MNQSIDTAAVVSVYEHKAVQAGIREADIRRLIPAFYARVRVDPILGPVFEGIIGDNWETHIETVCSFWLCVTRLDQHYSARNFVLDHLRQPTIRADLLPRWLAIFREMARECCTPAQADVLIDIAQYGGVAPNQPYQARRRSAQFDAVSVSRLPAAG